MIPINFLLFKYVLELNSIYSLCGFSLISYDSGTSKLVCMHKLVVGASYLWHDCLEPVTYYDEGNKGNYGRYGKFGAMRL